MITKWFIGVSAKSKGFFTGWVYSYSWRYRTPKDEKEAKKAVMAKPSFTKQTALATTYSTEQEAKEGVNDYREECNKEIKSAKDLMALFIDYNNKWSTKTPQEQRDLLDTHRLSTSYKRNRWGYNITRTTQEFNKEEAKALREFDWRSEIKKVGSELKLWENRLKFVNEKLIVREQDLEFKFMDKERWNIKWEQRGENSTSHSYCNCCGGAIPDIPQLVMRSSRGYGSVIICAICMGKLAEEAKIQSEKVSDEIMEHYQTDRFLRSLS